ncbi:MAG: N-acetylmuramoyl-L-alanine amidase [Saprospiraceae bacterium]|nr:N-acetylmuramoyl-L-alanine amidase [Saprospiraceae bacterium]
MTRVLFICFSVFWGLNQVMAVDQHAVAKVKKGDNIEKLLKRYLLTPHTCNIQSFCQINKLENKELIMAGKVYKLPILIIQYNGKSIRSSMGMDDLEKAKKIEKLNTELLKAGIRDKHFKESKRIWVPMTEFECDDSQEGNSEQTGLRQDEEETRETDKTSTKGGPSPGVTPTELKRKGIKEINVPLMGEGYDLVHVEDMSLSGNVYYIISGHGGPDPGAVCSECQEMLCEDEYAYDVALRLARNLMQHGATVHVVVQDANDGIRDELYLACDNDELLNGKHSIPVSQKKRLSDRASAVNRLYHKYRKQGIKNQKAIEIHVDSRNKNTRQDVFFYYNKEDKKGKKLAENVQDVFASKYDKHQKDRGYKGYVEDRGIYMVRNVLPTMLFVELANIKNASDQKRLLINTNRQALANWLFEGLRKE